MHTNTYDSYLANLRSPEDWLAIPEEDVMLFTVFGTVAPLLATRTHRLIPDTSECLKEFLQVLQCTAALAGRAPRLTRSRGADYDYLLHFRLEEQASEWSESANQEWLIHQIGNIKFEDSGPSILFNAQLGKPQLMAILKAFAPVTYDLERRLFIQQLGNSRTRTTKKLPFREDFDDQNDQEASPADTRDETASNLAKLFQLDIETLYRPINQQWWQSVNDLVDQCGWFYITLPESTRYNLSVFGGVHAELLAETLDSRCSTARMSWKDGRAHWPGS